MIVVTRAIARYVELVDGFSLSLFLSSLSFPFFHPLRGKLNDSRSGTRDLCVKRQIIAARFRTKAVLVRFSRIDSSRRVKFCYIDSRRFFILIFTFHLPVLFRDNETAIHDAPLFSRDYSIWAKFRGYNVQSRAALSECTREPRTYASILSPGRA